MVDLYTNIKSAWGYCTKFEWDKRTYCCHQWDQFWENQIFWIQRYDFQAGTATAQQFPRLRAEAQVDWIRIGSADFLQVLSASSEQLYEAPAVAVAYELCGFDPCL